MPSQRPFFLSTFFAAFRQQPSLPASAPQPNKHTSQAPSSSYTSSAASAPRTITSSATTAAGHHHAHHHHHASQTGVIGQLPLHSPRTGAMPIPQNGSGQNHARRRGSDSSSEGFREVIGADKLYIGGRTATGEEKFFKLGVVRRVRSGDRLSLDRLSL